MRTQEELIERIENLKKHRDILSGDLDLALKEVPKDKATVSILLTNLISVRTTLNNLKWVLDDFENYKYVNPGI